MKVVIMGYTTTEGRAKVTVAKDGLADTIAIPVHTPLTKEALIHYIKAHYRRMEVPFKNMAILRDLQFSDLEINMEED